MWSTNSPVNNSALESKALARARAKELSDSIRAKNVKSKAPTSTASNGTKVTNSPTINSNRGPSSIPAPLARASSSPAPKAKSSSIPTPTLVKSSSIPAPRLSSNTNSSTARSSSTLRSQVPTNVGSTTPASNTSRSTDFSRSTRSSSAVPRRQSTPSSSTATPIPFSNKLKSTSTAATASVSPQSSFSVSTASGISKPSSRLSINQRTNSVGGTRDNTQRTLVKEVFVEETSTYSIKAVPTIARDDQSITTAVSSIHSNTSSSIIRGMSNKHQENMMKIPISDLLEIDNHYIIEPPRQQPMTPASTASLINASILAVPKKSDLEFLNQSILSGPELTSEPKSKFIVPEMMPDNNKSNSNNNNNNNRSNNIPSSSSLRSNNNANNNHSQHSSNNDNDRDNKNRNNNNNNNSDDMKINLPVSSYQNKQEGAVAAAVSVVPDSKPLVTPHHHRPLTDMGTMTDNTTIISPPPQPTILHTHNYNINTSPTHHDSPPPPPNIISLIQSMRSKTSLASSPEVINGFNISNNNYKSNYQTNSNNNNNSKNKENSTNYSSNNTTNYGNNTNTNMHSSSPSQVIHQQLTTAQQLLEAILSPSVVHYNPTFDASRTAPTTTRASPVMMGKGFDSYRKEPAEYRPSALISKQLDSSERMMDGVSTPNTDISAISQSTSIVMPSSSLPEAVAFTHTNQQHPHPVPSHEIGQVEQLPKTGVVAARLRAIRERITSHNFHSPN